MTLNGSGKLGGTTLGYGNPIHLNKNTTVILSSSSPTGEFYETASSNSPVNTTTVSLGENSFGFYYRDLTTGNHTITVSYIENGVSWYSDSYMITMKDPLISLGSENKTITTNMTSDPLSVRLQNLNKNDFSVPIGKAYSIKLTTSSL